HTRWPRDWSSDVCSSDLRRRVGEGVQGKLAGGPYSKDDQDGRKQQDDEPVLHAEPDQGIEHHVSPSLGGTLSRCRRRRGGVSIKIGRASCRESGLVREGV